MGFLGHFRTFFLGIVGVFELDSRDLYTFLMKNELRHA